LLGLDIATANAFIDTQTPDEILSQSQAA
jgi:hypothetical protein